MVDAFNPYEVKRGFLPRITFEDDTIWVYNFTGYMVAKRRVEDLNRAYHLGMLHAANYLKGSTAKESEGFVEEVLSVMVKKK